MSRLLFPLLLLFLAGLAPAGEVQVAVAANFAGPLAKVAEGFTAATGHTLKVSSGATGMFYAQVVAGAPFEVLIAADDATPKKLVAQGHAVAGSNFTYAIGRLVLWSAQPGFVDDQGAVLAAGKFAHLAIANPKIAPYGQAGMEVLKARGLTDAMSAKLVSAESIGQAYQFVLTGNAELGFVALSQVAVPDKTVIGSYWLVPPGLYGETRYCSRRVRRTLPPRSC
jgi:molybdate transport system substrate-binding protein